MGFGMGMLVAAGAVLMLASLSRPAEANLLSSLFSPGCAAVAGLLSAGPCSNEFQRSVKPFVSEDGRVPVPVACCAITTLRYCMLDKIGNTCGSEPKNVIDSAIKVAVSAVNGIGGDLPCDGDEFYYRKESPLCWAVWGKSSQAYYFSFKSSSLGSVSVVSVVGIFGS